MHVSSSRWYRSLGIICKITELVLNIFYFYRELNGVNTEGFL